MKRVATNRRASASSVPFATAFCRLWYSMRRSAPVGNRPYAPKYV